MNKTIIAIAAASTLFSSAAFAQYVPGSEANARADETKIQTEVASDSFANSAQGTYGYPALNLAETDVNTALIPGSDTSRTAVNEATRQAIAERPADPSKADRPAPTLLVPGSSFDAF